MPRLSHAALALLLAFASSACDSGVPDPVPLEAPGPDAYTLAVETDDSGVTQRLDGRVRYVLTDLPREAGYNTGALTLLPSRPGGVEGRIALYVSQDGASLYPDPGEYEVGALTGSPFSITFEIQGRTFSAYRGRLTVEAASETEFVGRIDVQVTTGGCGLLPTCEGPTRTGVVTARFRAEAEAERAPGTGSQPDARR